jgi:uncharacterized iron-regulated membrane protein
MKRQLYLWHRWLGIVLCLPIALWLVSGIVMLFIGYPRLLQSEQLARLPVLNADQCCVAPAQALAAGGLTMAPTSLRLSSVGGEPRYLLTFAGQPEVAVDARTGERIKTVDKSEAEASALAFAQGARIHYVGLTQGDMWSSARALDVERPMHLVRIDDDAGRQLYLSRHSGRVLLDVTANERLWNWLGAWLHWLYFIHDVPWWAEIVIYLSLAGTVVVLLGQVVGLLRWRFSRPYRHGSHSPYRQGFMRWHHIGGLLFGVMLLTWIFSGMMSMRPWKLLDNQSQLSAVDYQGGTLAELASPWPMSRILQQIQASGLKPVELEWRMVAGDAYLTAYDGAGQSRVLAMKAPSTVMRQLPEALLIQAAQRMLPDQPVHATRLAHYDFYYFARGDNSMYSNMSRRLPMLRIAFDDPARTWLQIDPYSGAIVDTLDARRRLARWIFNLLHSWDWLPLLQRAWLREPMMIAFSLGGLVISVSGMVIGWRRLRSARPS